MPSDHGRALLVRSKLGLLRIGALLVLGFPALTGCATPGGAPTPPSGKLPRPPLEELTKVDLLTDLTARIELPGVTADQVKIGLTNDKLRIWGEKKRRPNRRRIIGYLCSERSFGNFGRVVPLRWTVCIRNATAELTNGMLIIRLPKIQDRRGEEVLVAVKDA